jgi:hypothetical protein
METSVEFCHDSTLQCPNCRDGESYLHHEYAKVFERFGEDGITVETHVHETRVEQKVSHRNPSGRRDGIAIGFYCEQCDARLELTIAQHKGQTFVEWREKAPEIPPYLR